MSLALPKPATFIALAVIALCGWGIYQAVRIGVADVIGYKARYALSGWEQAGRLPTQEALQAALAQASSALLWEPGNPQHMDLKAHLLTYQGLLSVNDPQAGSLVEITAPAVALYQQSLRRRPQWPYTWARLALLKTYRGEFDAEYRAAIIQATHLGPWEPDVHIHIAEAGLSGWFTLDRPTRDAVVANVHRGLHTGRAALTRIADRQHKRQLLCAYLPLDRFTKPFCGW